MPDVRMPDGTIIKNVPEGTTQSELRRRLGQQGGPQSPAQPAAQAGFGRAFGNAALNQFVNNVLQIPEELANIGMQVAAFSPLGFVGEQAGVLPEGSGQPLGQPGRVELGGPTATDVRAGIETAPAVVQQVAQGQVPNVGETFQRERAGLEQAFAQQQEQQPIASTLGNLAGSAATLATGRAPIAQARAAGSGSTRVAELPTELGRVASQAINSQSVQKVIRGTGRSTETGIEGLTLSVLEGGDPLENAGFAAAGQAAGSLALSGAEGLLSGGVLKAGAKITLAAGAIAGLVQTAKSVAPGGKDFILESIETGFDKVALGLATGALAGVLGAGRGADSALGRAAPQIMDFMASLPRGAALGALNDALSDPETELVVNQISEDPDFFGPAARRRLNRALTSDDVSLSEEIERLKKDRAFRRKLESISPR